MLPPCHDLIKEFSTRFIVPVELDDVVAALLKRGAKDKIWYFLESDLDDTILDGALAQWEYTEDGKEVRCAHIDCAKTLHPQRKRLVVCKELLHLLDPSFMRVSNEEDFKKLTDNIGLPPEDQDPVKDGPQEIRDNASDPAALQAIADELDANTNELSAAVAANTPAAG